jgi:hypothetical protein
MYRKAKFFWLLQTDHISLRATQSANIQYVPVF